MTRTEVDALVKDYLFSAMPIAKADEQGHAVNAVIDAIKNILDTHMPAIRKAAEEYATTEDLDALILSLLPVHNLIWYEAYAPYWLLHCQPVSDDPDYTFFNDLIDMYWLWKHQLWSKREETCCTIMLPPTKGLVALDYAEAVKSLDNYNRTHDHHAQHDHNDHHAPDGHTVKTRGAASAATQKGADYGE